MFMAKSPTRALNLHFFIHGLTQIYFVKEFYDFQYFAPILYVGIHSEPLNTWLQSTDDVDCTTRTTGMHGHLRLLD